jgi:quercetin dioxygenase-like cupin family protein
MTRTFLGPALVLGLAVAAAAPSIAAAPPVVATPLAVGTMKATTIKAQSGSAILTSIKIAPGGSFGWHTHGAPVAVVVSKGTLTVFDPTIGNCKPFTVSKGQSFVEPANHVHLARNDTKTPVVVYAMYLGVHTPAQANVTVAAPDGCHA